MFLSYDKFEAIPIREVYAPDFIVRPNYAEMHSKKTSGYYAGKLEYTACLSDLCRLATHTTPLCCSIHIPYIKSGLQTKAWGFIAFTDQNGKKLQTDYLTDNGSSFDICIKLPKSSVSLILILAFRCQGVGAAEFSEATLEFLPERPHRSVHIASAFINRKGIATDNFLQVLEIIDKAGNAAEKPDIICFTESVYDLGCPDRIYISEDSHELEEICKKAKKNDIYVIFTTHERDHNDYYYNTAFLISNEGEICGKYRKCQLTMGEYMSGMVPGDELPVFDTPLGKIGLLICWDQWFYEASRVLASKGAEIIFWLTRGFHEERLVTRARDNGVFYVSCHPKPHNCCIVHPTTGVILARGQDADKGYVSASIDLDERPVSEYKSYGQNGGNDKHIFLNERRNDLYI